MIWFKIIYFLAIIFLLNFAASSFAIHPNLTTTSSKNYSSKNNTSQNNLSVSSNPATRDNVLGAGNFHCNGIRLGGAWIADENRLISGGIPHPRRWTYNNLLIGDLSIDTKEAFNWPGGMFGLELLQYNGQDINGQAGSIQGYNSLPASFPLNRFELYQLWYRQELFDKKLILRIGKTATTFDFGNVIKPIILTDEKISVPAVSGLIYTPLFVNSSYIGIMPGYYNSAYGVILSLIPVKEWYISYGIYDGSLARGVQTGMKAGPTFNGSYLSVAETGLVWLLGQNALPGNFAVGAWHQKGVIKNPPLPSENSASGLYFFGSQRIWYQCPNINSSGISVFYQYGMNNSKVLPMPRYVGAGLTAYGLVPCRVDDSMGIGSAIAWLNQNIYNRRLEPMFQMYYQAQIVKNFYLEPVLTYIPTPGASPHIHSTWAGTLRGILFF